LQTLILDQYARQSVFKRGWWLLLTLSGWAFWCYMWEPLAEALIAMAGSHGMHTAASPAERAVQTLLSTLNSHAHTVLVMVAFFLAWALLRWRGGPRRDPNADCATPEVARLPLSRADLDPVPPAWRHARRLRVQHDDRGRIRLAEILDRPSIFGAQHAT
jgi:poly-beta-1,6-N-acetyl-D-glucosamine biosynthesis protein PgaD